MAYAAEELKRRKYASLQCASIESVGAWARVLIRQIGACVHESTQYPMATFFERNTAREHCLDNGTTLPLTKNLDFSLYY